MPITQEAAGNHETQLEQAANRMDVLEGRLTLRLGLRLWPRRQVWISTKFAQARL